MKSELDDVVFEFPYIAITFGIFEPLFVEM